MMGEPPPKGVRQGKNQNGEIIRLDKKNGYFGVKTRNGRIKTFFRPNGDPLNYFKGQDVTS